MIRFVTCFSDSYFHGEVEEVRISVFHLEFGQDGLNQFSAGGAVGNAHCLVFHVLHQAADPHPHRGLWRRQGG